MKLDKDATRIDSYQRDNLEQGKLIKE